MKRKTYLILEWIQLPKEIKEIVTGWCGFHNDCLLKFPSEFKAEDLCEASIKGYWKQQKKDNNFKGTLEDFIREYNLGMEIWIIEQKFDLQGVDEIVVEVCW